MAARNPTMSNANPAPDAPLALFDLDHTLIPFDSGMAWTDWLTALHVLDAGAPARYLGFCQQYVDGTLDIRGLHAATVAPLARLTAAGLDALVQGFAAAMAPRLPASRLALVARHRAAGHRCVLVTATTRFIAEAFGALFGLHAVLATESTWRGGRLTGEILGEPCWQAHKLTHVQAWLAPQGQTLANVAESWFYSDAASDLPLLRAVTHPVAVRPDGRLRAEALAQGWPIVDN